MHAQHIRFRNVAFEEKGVSTCIQHGGLDCPQIYSSSAHDSLKKCFVGPIGHDSYRTNVISMCIFIFTKIWQQCTRFLKIMVDGLVGHDFYRTNVISRCIFTDSSHIYGSSAHDS
jgi:hypothetical protein